MFSWGLLSGAMAFVGGPTSFYVVRVLLGIAEAGFFPGIIFFLTLWFPAAYRARIIGYFHGGGSVVRGDRRPSVWTAARTGWPPRHEGMAVAVHHRSRCRR